MSQTLIKTALVGSLVGALISPSFMTVASAQDKPDSKPKTQAKADAEKAAKPSVEQLLKNLGADDYDTREAATAALIKLGRNVLSKVEKLHKETKDPEVKSRTRFIIDRLHKAPKRPRSIDRSNEGFPKRNLPRPKGGLAPVPGMPDMNDMMKQLNLPKEFAKIFEGLQKELEKEMRGMLNPNNPKAPGLQPGKPRIRVWSNLPKQPQRPRTVRRARRHATGLAARPTSNALRTHLRLKNDEGGIVVTKVHERSWGQRAGLKLHDIVLKIDGQSVSTLDDFDVLLKKGDLKVEIIRQGQRQTLTLPKRPATKAKSRRDF